MPPLTCPPPRDCPLYAQRLAYGQDESLRRAVLSEHGRSPDLAALIRAEQRQAVPVQPAFHQDLRRLPQLQSSTNSRRADEQLACPPG